jgi:hypothetical protein
MPTHSEDNVVRLEDRRPRTVQPIDPASLARIYDSPRQPPLLIPLEDERHSGWREAGDVAAIALILLTIMYFAAQFARAYLASNL